MNIIAEPPATAEQCIILDAAGPRPAVRGLLVLRSLQHYGATPF
jgi:hypothetical protein